MKSGLRILIRAPEVPFLVPPKTPKMGVFGYFGGTENGTSGARIKILRPLFKKMIIFENNDNKNIPPIGTKQTFNGRADLVNMSAFQSY